MSSPSVSHQKRRLGAGDPHAEHDDIHPDPSTPPPRRSRRRRWLILTALLLLLLLWGAPIIIARSPLLGSIVGKATSDLNGTASVESASLGWFSPVRVSGIQVRDKEDNLIADAPTLEGDTSLVRLAWNTSRLGKFTLDKPTVNIVLRPDGSNVEELIANYLTGSSGEPVAVALEIKDATVHIKDEMGGQPWSIEHFNLSLTTSDKPDGPMTLSADGTVDDAGRPGQFSVEMTLDEENKLSLKTTGLELAKLNGLLARFAPGTRLAGRLDATAQCRWKNNSDESSTPAATVAAEMTIQNLDAVSPTLGSDRLRLATLQANCDAGYDQGKYFVNRAGISSDVGEAALTGRFEFAGEDLTTTLESLLKQTFKLTGRIDLARAAQLLPSTLRVDRQTQVTAGQLKLSLENQLTQKGMTCQGAFDVGKVTAVHRGQPIRWEQPISVSLAARYTDAGPIVDRFKCQSSFLLLEAQGSKRNLNAYLKFDLDQLARQLRGLIDLRGVQIAGNGSANVGWKQSDRNEFRADADLRLYNLHLSLPLRQPWIEDRLAATMTARGTTDFKENHRLDSARLEVKTNGEHFIVQTARPVARLSADGPWPLAVDAKGDLAYWRARLQAWNLLGNWTARGPYHLKTQVVGSRDAVEIINAELLLGAFRLAGNGLNVEEPNARLTLTGRYDLAKTAATVPSATLACPTLTVALSDLKAALPADQAMTLTGALGYESDLSRLQQWITAPGEPPTWQASGKLKGAGRLKQTGNVTSADINATITNLVLQGQNSEPFRDRQTQLALRGSYDSESDRLTLEDARLLTAAAGLQVAGNIDSLGDDMKLDLAGQVGYDWKQLTPLLQTYVGDSVRITGRGGRPLSCKGPPDLAKVKAVAGIDWSGVYAYGFQVGPGELKVRLSDGLVETDPLDLAVSEGQLTARPKIRLAPQPVELEVEPGPLLRQVRINPDMCRQGLQYVAPVLAGVATAEGRFSVHLDKCRIRFDDPAKSELAGKLTVHSIEIGPGPLVRELAVVLNRVSAAKLQRESTISFRLAKGRVHHEGLELVFPELTVRTQGSVGLDQTLALTAEMPIPPKWLAGQRLLNAAFANQKLQVPIRGTLSKPAIDHRKLDEYNRKLFGRAVEGAVKDELKRQLNRWLNPKR